MATLYVENVPDEVFEALRAQAKSNRRSIAAELMCARFAIPSMLRWQFRPKHN